MDVRVYNDGRWGINAASGYPSIIANSNPGMIINDDLNALWIGGDSEADSVYVLAQNFGNNTMPIKIGVNAPWVGLLKSPILVYPGSYSPAPNWHYLQLCGVVTPDMVPHIPEYRAPLRKYNRVLVPANPTPTTSNFFMVFGRKYMSASFINEGTSNVTVQPQIMNTADLTGGGGGIQAANWGTAFVVNSGSYACVPLLQLAGGNGSWSIPTSQIRFQLTSALNSGQFGIFFEALD